VRDFVKYKIYCDGAASNNGYENAIGGWGFVILDENEEIIAEGAKRVDGATNNRMELYAAVMGIMRASEIVNEKKLEDVELEVYTDSAYLHNCKEQHWYGNWIKNNWRNSKKQPVANKDLWERIVPLFENPKIEFFKVKGHANDKWNEYVDNLAIQARKSEG
jgi:ribonuclease HI